jgi:hypothetical protein
MALLGLRHNFAGFPPVRKANLMKLLTNAPLDNSTLPPDNTAPLEAGGLLSDNLNARFRRMRSYAPSHRFTDEQAAHLRRLVDTLACDLQDPCAVETLLVLLEVFYTLDVPEYYLVKVFGARRLRYLRTWGDIVSPRRRPKQLRRAWVWVPNQVQPRIYPIAEDGTLRIYNDPAPSAE